MPHDRDRLMRPAPRFLQGGIPLPKSVLWMIVGLSLCAGVLGFSLGRDIAALSETEAIAAYATIYAQDTGGDISDCAAIPGNGAVWLIVRCGTGAAFRSYRVARDGGLVKGGGGPSA
ncbi:hypothetical protein [Oceaniglobus ichthyenteri]|uniref:hypothetical protein n=1 Tax=Oceaniglobus ichthyenteri TaxID=2136177 RepID=UPI000F83FDE1|nr:hypothetical protein [Oceaniglobus ichthyenteri]